MKSPIALLAVVSLALNGALAYKLWLTPPPVPPVPTVHSTVEKVVMRKPGGLLEVSTISTEERFESSTQHMILGVPVGSTVAMIRVPAVFRYHIPLAKDWDFRLSDGTLLAIAPAVQPSLPVAINTAKIESFSAGVWSPFIGSTALHTLLQSITPTLAQKAATKEMLQLQRESARQTVGEFVQKWVVEQDRWKGTKLPTVLVLFEDEPLGKRAAPLIAEMQ
jgi:hypothetical protein